MDFTGFQIESLFRESAYGPKVVTHEDHRTGFMRSNFAHLPHALPLELKVSNGENFVHEQDVGLKMSSDSECETDVHAGTVMLHRSVDEFFHFRKRNDLVKLSCDLGTAHTED